MRNILEKKLLKCYKRYMIGASEFKKHMYAVIHVLFRLFFLGSFSEKLVFYLIGFFHQATVIFDDISANYF
jgi:hypothetical protein